MQTSEYGEIAFYEGFKKDLPPLLTNVLPLGLTWGFLMGRTENYISALEAEEMIVVEGKYPFDDSDMDKAWKHEMGVLLQAVEARSESDARTLARQFRAQRDTRRVDAKLSDDLVNFERHREWLEGLAVVLDRLAPGWKERIITSNLFLDDLLREAVQS